MKYLSGLSSKLMLTAFVCASGLSSMASTASAQWGSIAFDETTFQYGYRVASPTQADAESGAMGWCRNGGSTNCRVVYSFTGGTCGTLAVSENRRFWFRQNDQGTRPQQIAFTQAASVAQCAQAGGVRCAPQVTICSDQPAAIVDQRQGAVSSAVLNFAASNLGQQVGNGQCWSLIDAALASAGAVRPGQFNFDTYVFGMEVYRDYRPGDIVQFENVRIESPGRYDEFPHHTAIIGSANGTVINLYQQNVNGDMRVQTATVDIRNKVRGLIRIYRPIPL